MLDLKRDGYYIIKPDHMQWDQVEFTPCDQNPRLAVIQKAVGGYIELIGAGDEPAVREGQVSLEGEAVEVYRNEDGRSLGLEVNRLASRWTWVHTLLPETNIIVGNLIILCGEAREPKQPEEELEED